MYGWGPEEEGRLSSLLYLAETAAVMDMSATVFFFTDGATIAKAGAAEKISEEVGSRFESIAKNRKVKILVCEEAARKRGITQKNLREGVKIAGYSTFLDIAVSADTVITL